MEIRPYTTVYEGRTTYNARVTYENGVTVDMQGEADTDWEALAKQYDSVETGVYE